MGHETMGTFIHEQVFLNSFHSRFDEHNPGATLGGPRWKRVYEMAGYSSRPPSAGFRTRVGARYASTDVKGRARVNSFVVTFINTGEASL